jgi:hypothetical protein
MSRVKLNFVTIAAPRLCVEESINSFINNCADRELYDIHWIVHIDYIDSLVVHLKPCIEAVHRLSEYFDSYTLLVAPTNKGHEESFHRAMQEVTEDFLYIEDDKVFTQSFKLADILETESHYNCMEGPGCRAGGTLASFWRKELAFTVCKEWPDTGIQGTEPWCKWVCKQHGFHRGPRFILCKDIGMNYLTSTRLVRKRKPDSSPYYEEVSRKTVIATYVSDGREVNSLKCNLNNWKWNISLDSYTFLIGLHPTMPIPQGAEEYPIIRGPRHYFEKKLKRYSDVIMVHPFTKFTSLSSREFDTALIDKKGLKKDGFMGLRSKASDYKGILVRRFK